jgi:hypothetical protein
MRLSRSVGAASGRSKRIFADANAACRSAPLMALSAGFISNGDWRG